MIKEFLNDKNYRLFELQALQNYLNKLTKLDMEILFQQENKETKTKKITIQVKKYTITLVLKRILPKFETLLVKVYNEDNINIEQITFSYDESYQIEKNSNYYIDIIKLVQTNRRLQIIRKSNFYFNNNLIKAKNSYIKTSKEELKEYFNHRVSTLSKDVESYYYNICNYNKNQVYNITKRNTDLQQTLNYLIKERRRKAKSKKLSLTKFNKFKK